MEEKTTIEKATINKPITLVKEEFSQNLISLINESKLPLFIIEPILKEILSEVQINVKRQLEMDRAEYNKALEEQREQTDKKEKSSAKK